MAEEDTIDMDAILASLPQEQANLLLAVLSGRTHAAIAQEWGTTEQLIGERIKELEVQLVELCGGAVPSVPGPPEPEAEGDPNMLYYIPGEEFSKEEAAQMIADMAEFKDSEAL